MNYSGELADLIYQILLELERQKDEEEKEEKEEVIQYIE